MPKIKVNRRKCKRNTKKLPSVLKEERKTEKRKATEMTRHPDEHAEIEELSENGLPMEGFLSDFENCFSFEHSRDLLRLDDLWQDQTWLDNCDDLKACLGAYWRFLGFLNNQDAQRKDCLFVLKKQSLEHWPESYVQHVDANRPCEIILKYNANHFWKILTAASFCDRLYCAFSCKIVDLTSSLEETGVALDIWTKIARSNVNDSRSKEKLQTLQQLHSDEEFELSELERKIKTTTLARNELVKAMKKYMRDAVYSSFPPNPFQQPLKLKIYGSDLSGIQLNREDTAILRGGVSVLEALCVLSRYALPGWGFRLLNDDDSVHEDSVNFAYKQFSEHFMDRSRYPAICAVGLTDGGLSERFQYQFITVWLEKEKNTEQVEIGSSYQMDMYSIPVKIETV